MRNRTEEINVRVFKTEKNLIRRKARKCDFINPYKQ